MDDSEVKPQDRVTLFVLVLSVAASTVLAEMFWSSTSGNFARFLLNRARAIRSVVDSLPAMPPPNLLIFGDSVFASGLDPNLLDIESAKTQKWAKSYNLSQPGLDFRLNLELLSYLVEQARTNALIRDNRVVFGLSFNVLKDALGPSPETESVFAHSLSGGSTPTTNGNFFYSIESRLTRFLIGALGERWLRQPYRFNQLVFDLTPLDSYRTWSKHQIKINELWRRSDFLFPSFDEANRGRFSFNRPQSEPFFAELQSELREPETRHFAELFWKYVVRKPHTGFSQSRVKEITELSLHARDLFKSFIIVVAPLSPQADLTESEKSDFLKFKGELRNRGLSIIDYAVESNTFSNSDFFDSVHLSDRAQVLWTHRLRSDLSETF